MYSNSYTNTYSITYAKYLASKVATDLLQMQLFHGRPSNQEINDYEQELAIFLKEGCLGYIVYGFKRNGNWVPGAVLRYDAQSVLELARDDDPGDVSPLAQVQGAAWYSFMIYNSKWAGLIDAEKNRIMRESPIERNYGIEPSTGSYSWSTDKSYSRSNVSLYRQGLK